MPYGGPRRYASCHAGRERSPPCSRRLFFIRRHPTRRSRRANRQHCLTEDMLRPPSCVGQGRTQVSSTLPLSRRVPGPAGRHRARAAAAIGAAVQVCGPLQTGRVSGTSCATSLQGRPRRRDLCQVREHRRAQGRQLQPACELATTSQCTGRKHARRGRPPARSRATRCRNRWPSPCLCRRSGRRGRCRRGVRPSNVEGGGAAHSCAGSTQGALLPADRARSAAPPRWRRDGSGEEPASPLHDTN